MAVSNLELDEIIDKLTLNDPTLVTLDLSTGLGSSRPSLKAEGAAKIAQALLSNSFLTKLFLRGNNLKAEGGAHIANALSINSTLTSLHLNSNGLTAEGAAHLAVALSTNSTLTSLNLRSNLLKEEGARWILEGLSSNFTLTTLNVTSNELKDEGFAHLANALVLNSTLSTLILDQNKIGAKGLAHLANMLSINSTLTSLSLGKNILIPEGVEHLARALSINSALIALDLYDTNLNAEGVAYIAKGLSTNHTLLTLSLWQNSFGAKGAIWLAEILSTNSSLTDLNLGENELEAEGSARIAEALSTNSTLTKLDLYGNDLQAEGVARIAEALSINSTLTELNLTGNDLKAEGAAWLAEALSINSTLLHLHLTGNGLKAAGAARIAAALLINSTLTNLKLNRNKLKAEGASRIADALLINSTLTFLDLDGNEMKAEGARMIAQALTTNRSLLTLDCSFNQLHAEGAAYITEALLTNSSLTALELSGNELRADAAKGIAKILDRNSSISSLQLAYNDLNAQGASIIASTLSTNITLTHLDLSHNDLKFEGAELIAEALSINSTLTTLDLNDNNFTDRKLSYFLQSELAFNKSLPSLPRPYLHNLCALLPPSQTIDLSHSDLTTKQAELLPFHSAWHGAVVIDMRGNRNLMRLPRSLGYLDPKVTRQILFDEFASPQEETYRLLPHWHFLMVMRFKLTYDGSPLRRDLSQHFNDTTGVLNLRGLGLTNEQMVCLPIYEPRWWGTRQIDLRDNPRLTQIPACLGFLDPMVTRRIEIDAEPLISSMRPFARSAEAMIGYARGLLEGELILLNQVKLMVVGRAAVGKTTLVRALYGQRFDAGLVSTDGIDMGEFIEQGVRFATWDFGGQKVYRFTHQLFLADNALYLLLFKLTDRPEDSMTELRFWLNSVLSRSPANDAKVLLVGTHADKSSSSASSALILSTLRKEYGADVISQEQVFVVSPLAGRETSIKTLRSAISSAAQSINVRAPPEYGIVQQHLEELQREPPIIGYNEVVFLLTARLRSESGRIGEILKILDYLGTVCVFEHPQSASGGVVVLRPQWVATLLATIVTTSHRLVSMESGIISHHALTQQAWSNVDMFPTKWHDDLIKLLEELQVLFEVPISTHDKAETCYFVPCMLREEPPDLSFYLPRLVAKCSEWRLRRTVCLRSGAVPVGVLPPILIALMRDCQLVAKWQQGCVGRLLGCEDEQEVWVQLSRINTSDIEVAVFGNCCRQVTSLLRRVTSMVVQRLTQFYHLTHIIKITCTACSSIDMSVSSWFDHNQLFHHIVTGGDQAELRCEPHQLHGLGDVRLDRLAPELLMMDLKLQHRFVFDYGQLKPIKELGKGAFGQVLLMVDEAPTKSASTTPCSSQPFPELDMTLAASCSDQIGHAVSQYAVKILLDRSKGVEPDRKVAAHQEFIGEVCLMCSLTHPNVVKLLGICTEPLAMVMEVVGGGDLYGQIIDPFNLKSSVFGFVQLLREELSLIALFNFRNVFLHRYRLSEPKLKRLLAKCQEVLQEEFVKDAMACERGAVGWIEHQYAEGLREPPLLALESQPLDECYGIKEEDWKANPLEMIAEGGWEKMQQKLMNWKEVVEDFGLGQEAQKTIDAFCAVVEGLYRDGLSREAHAQMTRMLDELQQVLKEHAGVVAPIDWVVRLKLATDIARGMVYLHELNPPMVHRDLKSPNIFLMQSLVGYSKKDPLEWAKPLAKVGDFGLSLRISSGHELQIRSKHRDENDPVLHINPTWAAPEILNGGRYTTMVDVYAMGILLWELLVRAHPFKEINMMVLKEHVLAGERPSIPAALTIDPEHERYLALMRACWSPYPGDRPSMRDVFNELREMCRVYNQQLYQVVEPLPEHHHLGEEKRHAVCLTRPPVVTRHSLLERSPATAQAGPSAPAEPGSRCHLCQKTFGKVLNRKQLCKRCRRAVCKECLKCCCSKPAPYEPGSVSSAAEESIVADKISCMISPSFCRETLWMGFESGLVGLSELSREGPSEQLEVVLSTAADSHPMRVNAIAHQPNASGDQEAADSGGFVWTGSEDGTLSVWSARTTTSDDYALEAPMLTGMLRWMKPGKKSRMRSSWFQLEYGRLSWYTKRYEVTECGGIDCTRDICAVVCSENEDSIRICLKASPAPLVLHFEDELGLMSTERRMQLREWFRQLTNVSIPVDTQGRIIRVASQRLFNAGILALQHVDYDVWCVSSDFVVSQWSLSSAANSHGLHQSMSLHVKRCWQLDPSDLLSTRMRTVGGFVRVSACTLWLAVGNRWVLFDLSNPNADPQWTGTGVDSDDVASDKIAQAIVVVRRSGEQEIWTCDHSGKVAVWQADHPEKVLSSSTSSSTGGLVRPRRLGELLLDEWDEEREGLPYCLVQASQDQVWAGTSSGCVMAFDVGNRQLVPSSAQPLCSSHPLVHIRAVYALACVPLTTSSRQPADRIQSVVWGASRDRTLRRFVLV